MANPNVSAWFEGKLREISDIIHDTAQDAATQGENITKHHIETRGTAKSGKRGRVETGQMRDSVSGQYVPLDETAAEARWGWLQSTPGYAWFQELGFTHRGGTAVEGMYALTDSREEVMQNVKEDLRSKLRGL